MASPAAQAQGAPQCDDARDERDLPGTSQRSISYFAQSHVVRPDPGCNRQWRSESANEVAEKTMKVTVIWPSGNAVVEGMSVCSDDYGSDLRRRVEEISGKRICALVAPAGRVAWNCLLASAPVRDGDLITAVVPAQVRVFSSKSRNTEHSAFAVLRNGSVTTWGQVECGADSSAVKDQLAEGVSFLHTTSRAWAAVKDGGGVVVWGDPGYGGELSVEVRGQLESGVVDVCSTSRAFAALKDRGQVVCWGDPVFGGDCGCVQSQLRSGVQRIYTNARVFAAVKDDGRMLTWGDPEFGGDSDKVSRRLGDAWKHLTILETSRAFSAYDPKRQSVVGAWGDPKFGGDLRGVTGHLKRGVVQLVSNMCAFAALKTNGGVITWGDAENGGNSSKVHKHLQTDVKKIFWTGMAFAALKKGGRVVTWGCSEFGGDSSNVRHELSAGVQEIYATLGAFAAVKVGGELVTWGSDALGADSRAQKKSLRGEIQAIYATGGAFTAVRRDGALVSWGDPRLGGDLGEVRGHLDEGVQCIVSSPRAFLATKDDGTVITWGCVNNVDFP